MSLPIDHSICTQIIKLLKCTNMSMPTIAMRVRVSLPIVHRINMLESIRDYRGKRRSWVLGDGTVHHE